MVIIIAGILYSQKSNAQCTSPLVNWTVTTQNLRCNNDSSGSIVVNITGGSPNYAYSLYSFIQNPILVNNYPLRNYTFSKLSADSNYFLVVQVPIGGGNYAFCTQSIIISQPAAIVISPTSITNVSCNGGNTGSININVTGGTNGPYTYSWSNGATTQNISGLTAGNYTVTAKDANGCSKSATYTITQPVAITSTPVITNVTCNGASTGAISITPSGGTSPYTYSWSNGATTQNISNVAAGNYTVTITDSKNCSKAFTYTITQPAAISAASVVSNATCSGSATGAINITSVSGGTGPYTYSWSNGATTQSIAGLVAGNYTLTVTDSKNCTNAFTYTITQTPSITATSVITNPTCNGAATGAITISAVAGGTSPYTYSWSNGATSQSITAVVAGNYTLTITDSKNCTNSFPYTITQPAAITTTQTITNVLCNGASTGAITINSVAGGTGPYTYSWSNGAITQNISNVAAGNYSLTIKDSKNCTNTINYTVTQPAAITSPAVITNATCNGSTTGAITITPAGGTSPYSYSWSNGATTQNISNVVAGNYTVTIIDSKNCTATFSYTITQPASITSSSVILNASCNGGNTGAISITPAGGTSPYTYSWSNGAITQNISNVAAGNYTVTVTDSKNCTANFSYTITQPPAIAATSSITNVICNGGSTGAITITPSGGTSPYTYLWSNGSVTQNISNVAAGNYSVTITDSKNCSSVLNFTITQPAAITATSVITNVSCNGTSTGAISITPSGGTAPYTYLWSNGAVTKNISNVIAGNYSVTITDSKNCNNILNFTITQPVPITTTQTITNATCSGSATGAITINTVSGGTGPYTYLWSNGAVTQNISNVIAGNYSVTITDSKNCGNISNYTITEPSPITAISVITNATCNGASTGAISITPSGGTSPYTYLWSNGAVTQNISNVIAGNYSVTITDSKNCNNILNFTITQPTAIAATSVVTNATCNGSATGGITITPSGGTSPYTFLWSNGAVTQNISNVIAGNYSVTITDSKNCTNVLNFTITQPAAITATSVITNPTCNGAATGAISITPSGGTSPYTYLWSNGAVTQNISNVLAGNYSVTITDSKNCNSIISYTITQPVPITTTQTITNATCNGTPTGAITINSVSGGTGPYSYLWSNGAITQNISGLAAGPYSVTITDVNSCSSTISYTVSAPVALNTASTIVNNTCFGGTSGSIDLTVTGGNPSYTYSWNNGSTNQNISNLAAGNYTVTVTDASLCSSSSTFTITQPAAIQVTLNTINLLCNSGNTGSIALTTSGGTTPYSYSWNNGAVTQNISGLAAGAYSVIITDNNGCTKDTSATLTQPQAITISGTTTNVTCNGLSNGAVSINVSGGIPAYTYNWNNGSVTQNINNVLPGSYKVVVTDNNGCKDSTAFVVNNGPAITGTASASPTIVCSGSGTTISAALSVGYTPAANPYSFNNGLVYQAGSNYSIPSIIADTTVNVILKDINGCLSNPIPVAVTTQKINATIIQTPVSCNGGSNGSLTVSISGSSSGYTYSLNGGPFLASNVFSNLSAGNYTIVINNGTVCNSSYLSAVTQPQPLTLAPKTITNANPCMGIVTGSILLTSSGGNSNKNFLLKPNGINQTDSLFSNIAAGTYTIVVTDSKGCIDSTTATISQPGGVNIGNIKPIIQNVLCAGRNEGSIQLTNVTGGNSPYTYTLNGVTNNTSIFTTLFAGSYSMIITDSNNCKFSYPFTITQPNPILYAVNTVPATCNNSDGSIQIANITGGSPGYQYSINDGQTYLNSTLFTNLPAGTYKVRVIDTNACTTGYLITLPKKKGPIPYIHTKQPSCYGGNNGFIVVDSLSGGVPPFQYKLDTTNEGGSTVYSNLSFGKYTLTITDQQCTYPIDSFYIYNPVTLKYDTLYNTDSISLGQPSIITASTFSVDASDNYPTGMGGLFNIAGGTPGYLWSSDSITFNQVSASDSVSLTGLAKGTYKVYIQDNHGCSATFDITIQEKFKIPNLITPNNDGKNDQFQVEGLPAGSFFSVVNRWGDEVYKNSNYDNSWGGTDLSDGVYYYELKLPTGHSYKGWVEIIRSTNN